MKRYLCLFFLLITAGCANLSLTAVPGTPSPTIFFSKSAVTPPTRDLNATPTSTQQVRGEFTFILTSPQENEKVTTSPIDLVGTVSKEAVLSVNDQIYLLKAGKFRQSIDLKEGINVLEIIASDDSGNEIDRILTVIYEPVQE
jgi:hypothetical protein